MDKYLKELMQIKIISENIELSKMIEDIEPLNIKKANINHEFSIVVYKKQNVLIKIFKEISYVLSKIGIMKNSKEFILKRTTN